MFKKEALKTTALTLTLFLTFLGFFNKISYAQDLRSNCRNILGSYYIVNEVYSVCNILSDPSSCTQLTNIRSYPSEAECSSASIEKYGCTPQVEGQVFYTNTNNNNKPIFGGNTVSLADAKRCINQIQKKEPFTQPYCSNDVKFYQCKCSSTLVGDAGNVGLVISWITGAETYYCYYNPVIGNLYINQQKTTPYSPIQLIKVTANFLFYIACFIFVLNLLRTGVRYVQSEGDPDSLKTARTFLGNTFGGMIFLLLVSGLISYLINAFEF